MFRKTLPTCFMLLLLASACTEDPANNPPVNGDGGVTGNDGSVATDGAVIPDPDFAESSRGNVKFKKAERIRNDFAKALDLSPNVLCNEFGMYSCTDTVHLITLGNPEPYENALIRGLPDTVVTTPIAVDRIALHACELRTRLDLTDQSPVFFGSLPLAGDGTLDPDANEVGAAINTLYERIHLRAATASETEHLRQLYRDIAATGEGQAGRDWAILSCFSVLTTMESLFY